MSRGAAWFGSVLSWTYNAGQFAALLWTAWWIWPARMMLLVLAGVVLLARWPLLTRAPLGGVGVDGGADDLGPHDGGDEALAEAPPLDGVGLVAYLLDEAEDGGALLVVHSFLS